MLEDSLQGEYVRVIAVHVLLQDNESELSLRSVDVRTKQLDL